MGTNYYHHKYVGECCNSCGRSEEKVVEHIGKSSAGWSFSFHGTDEIRSAKDWEKSLLAGGKIFNEYDEEQTVAEFMAMVEAKKGGLNHVRDLSNPDSDYYQPISNTAAWRGSETAWMTKRIAEGKEWLDPEGHSFSAGEFS